MIELIILEKDKGIKTILEGNEEEIYQQYQNLIEDKDREDIKIKDTKEGLTIYKYF